MNEWMRFEEFMAQLHKEVGNEITIRQGLPGKLAISVGDRWMGFDYAELTEFEAFLAKVKAFKQEAAQ